MKPTQEVKVKQILIVAVASLYLLVSSAIPSFAGDINIGESGSDKINEMTIPNTDGLVLIDELKQRGVAEPNIDSQYKQTLYADSSKNTEGIGYSTEHDKPGPSKIHWVKRVLVLVALLTIMIHFSRSGAGTGSAPAEEA